MQGKAGRGQKTTLDLCARLPGEGARAQRGANPNPNPNALMP